MMLLEGELDFAPVVVANNNDDRNTHTTLILYNWGIVSTGCITRPNASWVNLCVSSWWVLWVWF